MKTRLLISLFAIAIALVIIAGAAAPASAQAPGQAGVIYHVVLPGEYVSKIAAQYGVTTRDIINLNHIPWPYWVFPGQVLKIAASTPAVEQVYIVRSGDTLYSISLKYGVSWQIIATANNLRYPYIIYVGQRLVVTGSQLTALEPPEQTVKNFYSWYLKEFQGDGPIKTKSYRSSPYLTAGMIQKADVIIATTTTNQDPFWCGQGVPTRFTVESGVFAAAEARAIVRTDMPGQNFTVFLKQEGQYWKIWDVSCAIQ